VRALVACEYSATVRDALRAVGVDAWSCDLRETEGDPRWHHTGDVREILDDAWDLLIAHPVCRVLANSGVRWLKDNPARMEECEQAAEFFRLFDRAEHIPMRCVENPVMHGHALKLVRRRATQFVQPWWFGDGFIKTTGLWLTGLPPLTPDRIVSGREQACWKMPPGPNREKERSRTYPGIARAMAAQWGNLKVGDAMKRQHVIEYVASCTERRDGSFLIITKSKKSAISPVSLNIGMAVKIEDGKPYGRLV